ncbi:MAG TPA: glycosyltransferase family 9 protein [Acetobacteraceae bacterium]|jgi:heptosyltransferase-3|nr:glycosyltransferase family 9 protein [Acetobacteraceae bacterium]
MRILFIAPSRIGDAVLSTGLIDHLLRRHQEARITVVAGPVSADVFTRMPNLARLVVIEKHRYDLHWLRLWAMAAGQRWDLVVDIRGSGLAWFLRARRRAIMRIGQGPKIAQLGRILGLEPPPLPVVWTGPEDRARAAGLLPPGLPIIALGPTANWRGKIWPPDRFAALFHRLIAGPLGPARVAILAGPGAEEQKLAAPLRASLPDAIDLSGRLSLPEAAACLARATLFVGNDSGLMHIAAAAGTPTIGLFGPTPADEYAPAGRAAAAVRSPTGRMEDLTVAAAADAACALLRLSSAA